MYIQMYKIHLLSQTISILVVCMYLIAAQLIRNSKIDSYDVSIPKVKNKGQILLSDAAFAPLK